MNGGDNKNFLFVLCLIASNNHNNYVSLPNCWWFLNCERMSMQIFLHTLIEYLWESNKTTFCWLAITIFFSLSVSILSFFIALILKFKFNHYYDQSVCVFRCFFSLFTLLTLIIMYKSNLIFSLITLISEHAKKRNELFH